MKPWSTRTLVTVAVVVVPITAAAIAVAPDLSSIRACRQLASDGLRPIAENRKDRFLGKVKEYTAICRGGEGALALKNTPWVDWSTYWGAGDSSSRSSSILFGHLSRDGRGVDGALLDLEYQRIEMIKFNLFENNTFEDYLKGKNGVPGRSVKVWDAMKLPSTDPNYVAVGGAGTQICKNELIRYRTNSGICNDIFNPAMGSTNMEFARNVQFEETYPDLGATPLTKNRHADRLDVMRPDPNVISRELLTREQSNPEKCKAGTATGADASCDYAKAPFFNVIAAYWIQFMTHDWFSHMNEGGNNAQQVTEMGCKTKRDGDKYRPLTPEEVTKLGCRPGDRIDRALYSRTDAPPTVTVDGKTHLTRAQKTTRNSNTAWWDGSQLYGYSDPSVARAKRDPKDPAKMLMVQVPGRTAEGDKQGYLPTFAATDPIAPQWAGQEAVAFPDNWSIGLSFLHNVFTREHNLFVDEFRKRAAANPNDDSGLRNPANPTKVIRNSEVTAEELYQAARLVVSAEIAKIHTIEWTTQLLYDEPLYSGMNANWHGLIREDNLVSRALEKVAVQTGKSVREADQTTWYGVFASGAGIFGLGSHKYEKRPGFLGIDRKQQDVWNVANNEHVNGGVNHFGSPFNFPEEFITVYRLHPLLPDLLDFRDVGKPNDIQKTVPLISTFRGGATQAQHDGGLSNWGLTMGRQRLGLLQLGNHPQFLQNLPMPRIAQSPTKLLDVPALDIMRDRERGVPRFNEFRRQYGLKTLTSFDDFVDPRLAADSPERKRQEKYVVKMREIYGTHICDDSKVITEAQDFDGKPITDCLGKPNGTRVDNIEDLDTVVGWLAEPVRPHGYAISETQFTVFIINASRRLFSDRFFTSSFRPEFYTSLGVEWVNNNGPTGVVMEKGKPNGHEEVVSPMKRVLLRTMPELAQELDGVVNAFDPWARDRGSYYSLQWKPRAGAENDPAFKKP
jgi:hypothetical protein